MRRLFVSKGPRLTTLWWIAGIGIPNRHQMRPALAFAFVAFAAIELSLRLADKVLTGMTRDRIGINRMEVLQARDFLKVPNGITLELLTRSVTEMCRVRRRFLARGEQPSGTSRTFASLIEIRKDAETPSTKVDVEAQFGGLAVPFVPRIVSSDRRAARWSPLAVAILALALRLHGLADKPLWLDEVSTLHRATIGFAAMVGDSLHSKHYPTYFALIVWLLGRRS